MKAFTKDQIAFKIAQMVYIVFFVHRKKWPSKRLHWSVLSGTLWILCRWANELHELSFLLSESKRHIEEDESKNNKLSKAMRET
jgi:hypothetical protein